VPAEASYAPLWRRAYLDVVLVCVALVILGINVLAGGLRLPLLDTDHQNQALVQSFFVLLAPLMLWLGLVLLAIRGWLVLLARRTKPERSRQLSTWPRAAVRWLGRRPARTVATMTLGSLAVAFVTMVVTFTATYAEARHEDDVAAFGADLRLEPTTDIPTPLPDLGPDVASTSPVYLVPARAGSDRKTIAAIDPATYSSTVARSPILLSGAGVSGLGSDRHGIVVSEEAQRDFDLRIGDTFPITVFPDDLDLSTKLDLHVVGVFRSFPPNDPFSEFVMSTGALSPPLPPPDMYLAKTRTDPQVAADGLKSAGLEQTYSVLTLPDMQRQRQRSLTALHLGGLGRIEAICGVLVAALGVGLLGAFTVMERRKEFALLRMVGASTRQLLRPPATEGVVAAGGALVTGVPIGIALAVLDARVLGMFFTLPPPLVVVPAVALGLVTTAVLVTSVVALGIVLRRLSRLDPAPLLREP
jgi:putative ABC transport system permease protein